MFPRRLLWLVLVVVSLVIASACSSGNSQTTAVPPTATGGSPSVPTNTLAPAAPTNTPAQPTPTVESSQPTATSTPTITPTQTLKSPAGTARPRQTAAPLNVTYEVIEIQRQPGDQATLVLKVIATGGSGGYRYYHDDIQQLSAKFEIAGTCGKPFVHTIKVISGDGQTMALPYHEDGVCPTPTP